MIFWLLHIKSTGRLRFEVKGLSPEQMREMLRQTINRDGSQKTFAEKIGVSAQYVCDCLQGRREIGKSIAVPLGYQPVTIYIPIEPMDK